MSNFKLSIEVSDFVFENVKSETNDCLALGGRVVRLILFGFLFDLAVVRKAIGWCLLFGSSALKSL